MTDGYIKILSPGLQTAIQDFPGRIGLREHGVNTAGPLDSFSFRVANFLAGNSDDKAGLEIQFVGPEIEFTDDRRIAVCGADDNPKKNGMPIDLWRSHDVKSGDRLSFGHPRTGARTYLAIAGGIDTPVVLGSRSTNVYTALGGIDGRALQTGDRIKLGSIDKSANLGMRLKKEHIPVFTNAWDVAVVRGPYDDYLTGADIDLFLAAPWKVTSKSDRFGYRLEGPATFEFSPLAHRKAELAGGGPTNIDDDYCIPVGVINICGQSPIIMLTDSITATGFICPFTVTTESIRKVGQARPGDLMYFHEVMPDVASRDAFFFSHLDEFCETIFEPT